MSLRDYFADDPDVQAMSEPEREQFFTALSDRSNLEFYFSDDQDVSAMQPEERRQFFDALAPEPVPTGGQIVESAIKGSFEQAGGAMLEGFGGATKFVGEVLPDAGVLENLGQSGVSAGQSLQQAAAREREIVRRGLGEAGAFAAVDLPAEVIRQAPFLAGGGYLKAVGKASAALATALVPAITQAFGSKYAQSRDAGYGVFGSGARAAVSGAAEGIGEAYALEYVWDLGKPVFNRIVKSIIAEGSSEMGTEGIDLLADYITDNVFAVDGENKPLLPANMRTDDAVNNIINAGIQVGKAGLMGAAIGGVVGTAMSPFSKAIVEGESGGANTVIKTKSGLQVVVPATSQNILADYFDSHPEIRTDEAAQQAVTQFVQDVQTFTRNEEMAAEEINDPLRGLAYQLPEDAKTEEFFSNWDAETEAQELAASLKGEERTAPPVEEPHKGVEPPSFQERKFTVTEQPLPPGQEQPADRVPPEWQPPAEASDLPSLAVGETVGISPSSGLLQQIQGGQATEVFDGVITRANPDGTYDVLLRAGGNLTSVPRGKLLASGESKAFVADTAGFTSPAVRRFVQKWLVPGGVSIENMTPEQRKVTLGSVAGVVENGIRRALGVTGRMKGEVPYIKLVYDLMRNDPAKFDRVFSHEIGHFIHAFNEEDAKKFGLNQFKGWNQFFAESIADKSDASIMTAKQEAAWKAWQARNETRRGKKTFIVPGGEAWNMMRAQFAYGDELNALWRQWALFPTHQKPRFNETMANALSAFLNRPAGILAPNESGKRSPGVDQFKLHTVFQEWVNSNPGLKEAWAQATQSSTPTLDSLMKMMERAGGAEAYANKLKKERGLTTQERYLSIFVDTASPFLNRFAGKTSKEAYEAVKDVIDMGRYSNTPAEFYMRRNFEERFGKQLAALRIPYTKMRLYALLRAITGSRWLTQTMVTVEGKPADTRSWLNRLRDSMETFVRSTQPELKGLEFRNAVQKAFEQMLEDSGRLVRSVFPAVNPDLVTPEYAQTLMNQLMAQVEETKPGNFKEMERLFNEWQEDRQQFLVKPLVDMGFFTDAQMNAMLKNKDYVTFEVVHHLFKNRSGLAEAQFGTMADVSDPIAATIEKDVRMWTWATYKDSMRRVAQMTEQFVPGMVVKVEQKPDGTFGTQPRAGFAPDPIIVEQNVDGRMVKTAYWVDESIPMIFRKPQKADMGAFSEATHWMTRWLTALNLGFGIVTNPIRDIGRSVTNLPGWAALWKLPLNYIKNLPDAFRLTFKGQVSPAMAEVIENRLNLSGLQYDPNPSDQKIDRLLHQISRSDLSMQQVESELLNWRGLAGSWWARTKSTIGNMVQAGEFASKAAAWQYLNDMNTSTKAMGGKGWTVEEMRNMARSLAGTPNLMAKGSAAPTLSLAFLFMNPAIQGTRGDIEAFKARPGQWAAKSIMGPLGIYGGARLFALAALGGYLDRMFHRDPDDPESWREFYRKLPLRWFLNYANIPIGSASSGESGVLTLPMDPVGQTFNAMVMTSLLPFVDPEYAARHGIGGQMFESGAGMWPQMNPMLSLFVDVGQIMAGKSPHDLFRGRDVIDKTTMESGDMLRIGGVLARYYLFDKGFGGPISQVYRLSTDTRAPRLRGDHDAWNKAGAEAIQDASGWPVLGPMLKRLFRFSDRGVVERQQWKVSDEQKRQAQAALLARDQAGAFAQAVSDMDPVERANPQAVMQTMASLFQGSLSDSDKELIREYPDTIGRKMLDQYSSSMGGNMEPYLQGYWEQVANTHGKERVRAILEWKDRYDRLKTRGK